jgi:hypothetical protein
MRFEKFTEGNEFLDSFTSNKTDIFITSITNEYSELAHNWFLSLKNINLNNLALVIALDEECYKYMLKNNIPSVYLNSEIKTNKSTLEWKENEKEIKVDGPMFISKKYKLNLFYSEVDIIFLKNPIDKIKNEIDNNQDMICLSDKRFDVFYPNRKPNIISHLDKNSGRINEYGESYQSKYGIYNFGFSYIPYSQKNMNFWEKLTKNSDYIKKFPKFKEEGNHQTILIKAINDFNISVKTLNPFEFVNGMIWNVPYLKNKIKNDCYLIHYNGLDGNTPIESKNLKIKKIKENNHWYV